MLGALETQRSQNLALWSLVQAPVTPVPPAVPSLVEMVGVTETLGQARSTC